MCGICRTVNCIRRRLFGSCGCNNNSNYSRENSYSYNGCDDDCPYSSYDNSRSNSRYSEPRTRMTCANQRDNGFTPCCDDGDNARNRSRNCGCGCND